VDPVVQAVVRRYKAAKELARKGKKYHTSFYGTDDGKWEAVTGYILGAIGGRYDWEMLASMSSQNEWGNYVVEGATEHNPGFRRALKEIVREYPEVLGFTIQLDGPWKSVRDLVGAPEEAAFNWKHLQFYHGTCLSAWESIEHEGLKPRAATNVAPAYGAGTSAKEGRKDAVYLTTQIQMAHFAARDAAKTRGSEPVVLVIRGLSGEHMEADVDSGETDPVKSLARIGSVAYTAEIPPSRIELFETFADREWVRRASTTRLDLSWVGGLRKDFLTLMKNLPRVKDYATAHQLRDAFRVYRDRFDEFFFEVFLNKDLKYSYERYGISLGQAENIDRHLRGPGWQFSVELLGFPVSSANAYFSEEAQFVKYQEGVGAWEQRMRKKAQTFWKLLKEELGNLSSGGFDVQVPEEDRLRLEGFQVTVKGYEDSEEDHREQLDQIKEGLRIYRRNASARLPWLLKNQLPLILEFETTLDKGGTYNHNGTITFYASSVGGDKGPHWVAHAIAHEGGHYLWKRLDDKANQFWSHAIKADYGDLDVQELINKWPGNDVWAFEFSKALGERDPILALQVESLHETDQGRNLDTKEDFQALLDRGVKTLRVPKTPITGYAGKSPEEAFCEAIGMLVSYGPRAVHERVRGWLDIIIPGEIKVAEDLALIRRIVSAFRTVGQ
jgi:hypothetical protein